MKPVTPTPPVIDMNGNQLQVGDRVYVCDPHWHHTRMLVPATIVALTAKLLKYQVIALNATFPHPRSKWGGGTIMNVQTGTGQINIKGYTTNQGVFLGAVKA